MIDWIHLSPIQTDKIAVTGLAFLVGMTVFSAIHKEAGNAAVSAAAAVILLGMIWMSHVY